MNEEAKFLEKMASSVPPEIAEDFYQYCKSILAPDLD